MQNYTKLKMAIAGSYLITPEQKKILIEELTRFTPQQIDALLEVIHSTETAGQSLINAALSSKNGKKLLADLKAANRQFNKTATSQLEKEEEELDLSAVEKQLNNL